MACATPCALGLCSETLAGGSGDAAPSQFPVCSSLLPVPVFPSCWCRCFSRTFHPPASSLSLYLSTLNGSSLSSAPPEGFSRHAGLPRPPFEEQGPRSTTPRSGGGRHCRLSQTHSSLKAVFFLRLFLFLRFLNSLINLPCGCFVSFPPAFFSIFVCFVHFCS